MCHSFCVVYTRTPGSKTAAFGILPDELGGVALWRAVTGISVGMRNCLHPGTGEKLHAFRPVDGGMLRYVEQTQGIHHGDICRVYYQAVPMRGSVCMKFLDIDKVEP